MSTEPETRPDSTTQSIPWLARFATAVGVVVGGAGLLTNRWGLVIAGVVALFLGATLRFEPQARRTARSIPDAVRDSLRASVPALSRFALAVGVVFAIVGLVGARWGMLVTGIVLVVAAAALSFAERATAGRRARSRARREG